MKNVIVSLMAFLMFSTAMAAQKDPRCYELRIYYSPAGKLDNLHARFRHHTTKLFEKHGIVNLGYWVPVDNPENKLIYVLSYPSRQAREQAWKDFASDPEWRSVQKASEVDGKLVSKVESILMSATDYSSAIGPSAAREPRLFELRTYKTAPGKLNDLHARFRNHTVGLFSKHGMAHFGYWTPLDKEKGADDTLIYILAHKNREAADASWKGFRSDPDWIAAKSASEANGPLTSKVESTLMTPTDYSPTR